MEYRCEWKELIDKETWDKGFILNPSNCESDIVVYLDYGDCICKRKVDKLVEGWRIRCSTNIEVKLSQITLAEDENKHKNKCSFSTLYIVLFSIIYSINIGIGTCFVYYRYINHDKKNWC